jgi:hypothetical protein
VLPHNNCVLLCPLCSGSLRTIIYPDSRRVTMLRALCWLPSLRARAAAHGRRTLLLTAWQRLVLHCWPQAVTVRPVCLDLAAAQSAARRSCQ